MDNHSTKGKSGLIRELIAKGLSVRKAEQAVNAVFDCVTRAAWRGEAVEIPGGTIKTQIMNGKPRQVSQRFRDVHTGEIAVQVVDYPGRRRVVKFRPDESLDLTPLPLPVPPATPRPEQIECRRLATELLAIHRKPMAMLRKTQRVAAGARRAKLLTTGDLNSVVGRFGSSGRIRNLQPFG